MKLVYLERAVADFEWMRAYCSSVFPEGAKRAQLHFHAAEKTLAENPRIGRALERSDIREFVIPRTPFSFIYRLRDDRIEVLRVWDNRADGPSLGEI